MSSTAEAPPADTTDTTCTCTPAWPGLVAQIDGAPRDAVPAEEHSAAETETVARCTGCAALWPGHWTLATITNPEAEAVEHPAKTAVEMLRLYVAERAGGEARPQQERMVEAVEHGIATGRHLVVQAGTGSGKSLGYLIPAILSTALPPDADEIDPDDPDAEPPRRRIVVSTATNQLSEQIVNEDLPTLNQLLPKIGGPNFTYALLKGRSHYACKAKIDSLVNLDAEAPDAGENQDALFAVDIEPTVTRRPSREDLRALNAALKWADTTTTGDRSDAPAVPDKVWDQISTDSAGCPGAKACQFGQECFSERARWAAREADVVVTNHAQVAVDLPSPMPLLGDYQVLIADEAHDLESYLSSAWGKEVAASGMKHALALAARRLGKDKTGDDARDEAKKVIDELDALAEMLTDADLIKPGLTPDLPEQVTNLLATIARRLTEISRALNSAAEAGRISASVAAERRGAANQVAEMAEAVLAVRATTEGMVRWLEVPRDPAKDRRGPVLKAAPLWIGPQLQALLGTKTLIATSATLTVGGSFDSIVRTLGLLDQPVADGEKPRGFDTIDVGTPFDYRKQGMLYVPGGNFPAPVYPNKDAHTAAVREDAVALITAAGGRTLALFTTTYLAKEGAKYLREHLPKPLRDKVLAQGDAPASQLIADFKADEGAVLCATRGLWHGVNAPGATLSCLIIDAIPFTPPSDPLSSARAAAADAAGRSGYYEVFVANAAIALAQGAGRLVRTATDRGVVAILDPRLYSKSYGPTLLKSVPPMGVFRDRKVVEAALTRLTGGIDSLGTSSASVAGVPVPRTARPAPKPTAPPKERRAAPRRAATRAIARNTKGKNPKGEQ